MTGNFYTSDLAYIHDVGFGGPALRWAPALLSILREHRITRGLVVDLGCGSGIVAEKLSRAGYQVLGVDVSSAFIRMSRKRIPAARFRRASLFRTSIPRCVAVVSTSECLNYMNDPQSNRRGLARLFRRIYTSLDPGGLLVFDLADPGQVHAGRVVRGFTEGDGWIVLVEKKEDHRGHILTRRIISFRKDGKKWRRGEEIHRQRLYEPEEIVWLLKAAGFRAHIVRRYGRLRLPPAHTAYIAQKATTPGEVRLNR